jgi:6-hydroxycyclohex-1-ene-1-carbonyl-CoA dehydrogenase
MRAAVLTEQGVMPKVQEIPTPEVEPDQVLIKVSACGVCHTDLHYIEHGVPTFKPPPVVLGHEASGTVAAIGDDAGDIELGTRVLVPAVVTCGKCKFCREGRENICSSMVMFGNHVDGAYAEYFVAPAKDVFQLPDSVPLEEGAVIADAVSTPYHAVVNRGRVRAGDVVVVFGCGGVGINAVQIASTCGAQVVAVDISDKKLEWAKAFGADICVNASGDSRISKTIRKVTGGGADVAFEVIGRPETIESAFDCVRPGGRLVVVGFSDQPVSLPAGKIMFREIEVLGSLGCRPVDYPRITQMCADGKIKVKEMVTHRFALENLADAFAVMKAGDALRSIVVP